MDHPFRRGRRLRRVGALQRALPVEIPARPAQCGAEERPRRRVGHRRQPVQRQCAARRPDPADHLRLDPVPLPAGRPAREVRLQGLGDGAGRPDRRRGLHQLALRRAIGQGPAQAQGPEAHLRQPGRHLARPGADAGVSHAGPGRAARLRHEESGRRPAGLRARRGHDRLPDVLCLPQERRAAGQGRQGGAPVLLGGDRRKGQSRA